MMSLIKLLILSLSFNMMLSNDLVSITSSNSMSKKESDKLYRRARSLEGAGFHDEAEQIYKQIFFDFPSNERYYNALKKILIKMGDCVALVDNVNIFCEAKYNSNYSKINKLEILLICNAEWESLFYQLVEKNTNDLEFLKKLISKLINHNQEDIATQYIYNIRSNNNDTSFFANELGYYYLSARKYPESLKEFLNHLNKNPKHLKMINDRIMSFPNEINLNKKIVTILEESTILESKIILADFYFKTENFQEAIQVLKKYNFLKDLLSLATNLNELGEFNIANELLIYIIENGNRKISQEAIFELAKSLEKRSLTKKSKLNISGFMDENAFFSSPFIKINRQEADLMHNAIAIYDSLSTNNANLIAEFKLSEIQFKALGDLDGAYKQYMKIYKFTKDKELKLNSILAVSDIHITKGQLDSALKMIGNELESNLWNDNDRIKLMLKQNQVLFYQSELDFVFEDLNLLLKEYSITENDYNNIIEVIGILILFKEHQEIFEKFTQAQLKIHQNKSPEAINILTAIDSNETVLLNNLINYLAANLLVSQNKLLEAIEKLESISGDDIYNELSQILLAEIHDYLLEDLSQAKIYYLSILQNFPNSIHYEQIRLRLKQIMENAS